MLRIVPLVFLALSACTEIPEVGAAEAALPNPGGTPALLTADELAALAPTTADPSAAMQARAAALRARAAALRQR